MKLQAHNNPTRLFVRRPSPTAETTGHHLSGYLRNRANMKWCNEPINSLSKLREIYLVLDQREVKKEEKTMKLHDGQHPYTAMVSQMPVNKL
ncbi:hypothetical protein KEM48_006308 [Puccinia striiformis f. sp. tritici PST-130]|nr:hypothetical protein KEM48_006308 [Puccinia striiformis f. sp. tritici PST-130]